MRYGFLDSWAELACLGVLVVLVAALVLVACASPARPSDPVAPRLVVVLPGHKGDVSARVGDVILVKPFAWRDEFDGLEISATGRGDPSAWATGVYATDSAGVCVTLLTLSPGTSRLTVEVHDAKGKRIEEKSLKIIVK